MQFNFASCESVTGNGMIDAKASVTLSIGEDLYLDIFKMIPQK